MRLITASDNWRTGISRCLIESEVNSTRELADAAMQSRELPPLSLGLIQARFAAPQIFDARTMLLGLKSLPALRLRHFRRPARRGLHRCLPDQREQPVARVFAVAFLGTVLLRDDHDDAFLGQSLARKPHQAHGNIVRQRRRLADIEAKLYGGRHLVDVLAARAGGAYEGFREFGFADGDLVGDADHDPAYQDVKYFFASTLPCSTAGWSKASMPRRCAAMMVSNMKCIISSPRLSSLSLLTWIVRTGQPFFASVSPVARPSAATRSPMVLPANPASPASLASSPSMCGPIPALSTVMTVNSLSRGPPINNCSWLCW